MHAPRALIVGLAGTELSEAERRLFAEARPAGFILFQRNCRDPEQLERLVTALHEAVPDWRPMVFIDQEGGRVARLKPPGWPAVPALRAIGDLAAIDLEAGLEAARLHASLIAADLAAARIDVVCAPVLDVATAAMTDAIGDRALSADPNLVTRLGRTMIEAFQASGVYPVIKHCPGHGRAVVDSHLELPQVKTSRRALEDCDFIPFRANNDTRFAMTAHIVYEALDPLHPASQSSRVIKDIIRDHLGFRGILLSDDISMEALSGGLVERSQRAIDAGCDLVVHCTGDFAEMRTLLQEMPLVDERVRAGLLEAADRPRNLEIAERPRLEELERHLQRLA